MQNPGEATVQVAHPNSLIYSNLHPRLRVDCFFAMASSESESHPSTHTPPKWILHSSFLRRRPPQQPKTSTPSDVTSSIRCPSPSSPSSPTQPHHPSPPTHHGGGSPPPHLSSYHTTLLLPQSQSRQCLLSLLSLLRPGLRPEVLGPGPDLVLVQISFHGPGPGPSSPKVLVQIKSKVRLPHQGPGPGPGPIPVQAPGACRHETQQEYLLNRGPHLTCPLHLSQHYSPPAEMLVITLIHHPHLLHPATANNTATSLPLSPPSSSPTVPFPVQSSRYPELPGLRPQAESDQIWSWS